MKQFNGYDAAKDRANYEGGSSLPVGAYVCKILDVKTADDDSYIDIRYDITEGDYKGFFTAQYENNTAEDKKYKGRTRIWTPRDDGSERDEWTKNSFAKWTIALEESNKGYTWDWEEKKWKNKMIGLVYGQTGTVINGKEYVYTECHYPISVEKARKNEYREPKLRKKNGYTGTAAASTSGNMDDFVEPPKGSAEEIPF